jgi:hypothetical protein
MSAEPNRINDAEAMPVMWLFVIEALRSMGPRLAGMFLAAVVVAGARQPPVEHVLPERLLIPNPGGDVHAIPIDWSHDPAVRDEGVRHVVVMVHGFSRRNLFPEIFRDMLAGEPRAREVAWFAPHFLCAQDLEKHGLDERHPYWSENGWVIGNKSRSDPEFPRAQRISSFTVIDELLKQAIVSFPNLESAVIGGFSAGGQFANRYAAGSRAHALLEEAGVAVRYVVASPSSYLYFCENRLVSRDPVRFGPLADTPCTDCDGFHDYRLGTRGLNAYMHAVGPDKLAANYAAREIDYLCGGADDEHASRDLANGCGAMLQGVHRLDRMNVYRDYLEFRFGAEVAARHRVHVIPGVAHGSPPLFANPIGRGLLLGPWITAEAATR